MAMLERWVMRRAERTTRWVGTLAGVAVGLVSGEARATEATSAPDEAPGEVAPPAAPTTLLLGGISLDTLGELFGFGASSPGDGEPRPSPSLGALGVVGVGGGVAWIVNRPDWTPAARPDDVLPPPTPWLGIAGAF